jgi:hypothetical protein
MKKRTKLLIAAVLYEGFWIYDFLSAPDPDEAMQTAGALFFGLVVPAFAGLVLLAAHLVIKCRCDSKSVSVMPHDCLPSHSRPSRRAPRI